VIRVAEKSAIERIRELDAERANLFEQAKEEALKKATDAITDRRSHRNQKKKAPFSATELKEKGLVKM
jgi:hypothetical protein